MRTNQKYLESGIAMNMLFNFQTFIEKHLLRSFANMLHTVQINFITVKIEHSILENTDKMAHIHNILNSLPRSVLAFVRNHNVEVVFIGPGKFQVRVVNAIILGRAIFDIEEAQAIFLITRAVLLLRYRGGRPFAMRNTLRSQGESIDSAAAKLVRL